MNPIANRRRALLELARERARLIPPSPGLERITFTRVAQMTGLSRSSLQRHWGTIEGFRRAVSLEVLQRRRPRSVEIGELAAELLGEPCEADELAALLIEAKARAHLDAIAEELPFLAVTASITDPLGAHDPEGIEALRHSHEAARQQSDTLLRTLASHFGLAITDVTGLDRSLASVALGSAIVGTVSPEVRDTRLEWPGLNGRSGHWSLTAIATQAMVGHYLRADAHHPHSHLHPDPRCWPPAPQPGPGLDIASHSPTTSEPEVAESTITSGLRIEEASITAALILLETEGLGLPFTEIRMAELLATVGLPAAAGNAIWPTHDDFQRDLVKVLLDEAITGTSSQELIDQYKRTISSSSSAAEALRQVVNRERQAERSARRSRLMLSLWRDRDPRSRQIVAEFHRGRVEVVDGLLEALEGSFGLTLRAPMTRRQLAWTINTVGTGHSLLAQIEQHGDEAEPWPDRPAGTGELWTPNAISNLAIISHVYEFPHRD